jgi:hypothetical protein
LGSSLKSPSCRPSHCGRCMSCPRCGLWSGAVGGEPPECLVCRLLQRLVDNATQGFIPPAQESELSEILKIALWSTETLIETHNPSRAFAHLVESPLADSQEWIEQGPSWRVEPQSSAAPVEESDLPPTEVAQASTVAKQETLETRRPPSKSPPPPPLQTHNKSVQIGRFLISTRTEKGRTTRSQRQRAKHRGKSIAAESDAAWIRRRGKGEHHLQKAPRHRRRTRSPFPEWSA